MMKFYTIIIAAFIFYSCKTASKLYDQGNYEDAVELAVKKLQKDPDDGETKALLKNAYRFAVEKHEDKVRTLSNSTSDNRYEKIYNEYRQLQNLYEAVQQSPAAASTVKAADYSNYLQTYKDKAAEVHYEKGLRWMEDATNKTAFREAYNEFRQAARFKSNDVDVKKKMQQAYDAAVVKVVIAPMDNYAFNYGYRNNSYQIRNFQEDVIRNLRYNTGNEFVQFYSDWDARSNRIQPDEILEMRMGRTDIGRPYDQNNTRQASKDVVVKEIVYKPDSVVKQYAKVYAQITTTQRTMVSEGELFVTSRDTNGRILWSDVFRGEHRWQVQFATYTGDERALSDNDRSLLNNRNNYNMPSEDEVLRNVLQQIQNEMNYRLRNYYSRY
jgi:hypothetical protein